MRRLATGGGIVAATVVLVLLAAALFAGAPRPAAASTSPDPDEYRDRIGGLEADLGDTTGSPDDGDDPSTLSALGGFTTPVDEPIRVALISSGVETTIFPFADPDPSDLLKALPGSVAKGWKEPKLPRAPGDLVGYGTWMASVILQLAPNAQIIDYNVYEKWDDGPANRQFRLDPSLVAKAVETIAGEAASGTPFDVVVYGFPPGEVLDPVSASMLTREWRDVKATINTDESMWAWPQRAARERYLGVEETWRRITAAHTSLISSGVAVVAPAGDVTVPSSVSAAPPQSILGIANMAEVLTVGAYQRSVTAGVTSTTIASWSGAGPAADGSTKPDLLAPASSIAFLPEASPLAAVLSNLVVSGQSAADVTGYEADWNVESVASWNTADKVLPIAPQVPRLVYASTYTAAAQAAVAIGRLGVYRRLPALIDADNDGVVDDPNPSYRVLSVATRRAALNAAAVPAAGVAVWRQGAGLLEGLPDLEFIDSRPVLAATHADRGVEPDTGTWQNTIALVGTPSSASISLGDRIDFAADGHVRIQSIAATDQPAPTLSIAADAITISEPSGDSYGGEYCGYLTVTFPASSSADTTDAIADDTEQLASCSTYTRELVARALYIHDQSAPDQTFELLPPDNLGHPIGRPFGLLPIRPEQPISFWGVKTNPVTGHTRISLPPGFYDVRLWADFSHPIDQGGASPRNIGATPWFSGYTSLVLGIPKNCSPFYNDGDPSHNTAGTGYRDCQKAWLQGELGKGFEVAYDGPSGGFQVSPIPPGVTTSPSAVVDDISESAPVEGPGNIVNIGDVDNGKSSPPWIRVNPGFARVAQPGSLASHYIDIVDPAADLRPLVSADFDNVGALLFGDEPIDVTFDEAGSVWQYAAGTAASVQASAYVEHTGGTTIIAGAQKYPFKLTSPNYKVDVSLNLAYEITNGWLAVFIKAGPSHCVPFGGESEQTAGGSSPMSAGEVPIYPVLPDEPIYLGNPVVYGRGVGTLHLECTVPAYGGHDGVIYFVMGHPGGQTDSVTTVTIKDIEFEVTTWLDVAWPAHRHAESASKPYLDGVSALGPANDGHVIKDIYPNYNPRIPADIGTPSSGQIGRPDGSDGPYCRQNSQGKMTCEQWSLLISSPKRDASTFDILDGLTRQSLAGILQSPLPIPAGSPTPSPTSWPRAGQYHDPDLGPTDHELRRDIRLGPLTIPPSPGVSFALPSEFPTNGEFFEQIIIFDQVLEQLATDQTYLGGRLWLCIQDKIGSKSIGANPTATPTPFAQADCHGNPTASPAPILNPIHTTKLEDFDSFTGPCTGLEKKSSVNCGWLVLQIQRFPSPSYPSLRPLDAYPNHIQFIEEP